MLIKCIRVLDLASFAALNDSPTYACQAADSADAERSSVAHTLYTGASWHHSQAIQKNKNTVCCYQS